MAGEITTIAELERAERKVAKLIEEAAGDLIDAGIELDHIKTSEVWMLSHTTWDDYCKKRWDVTSVTCNAWIERAKLKERPKFVPNMRPALPAPEKKPAKDKWKKIDEPKPAGEPEAHKSPPATPVTGTPKSDPRLACIEAMAFKFRQVISDIGDCKKGIKALAEEPYGWYLKQQDSLQMIHGYLNDAVRHLKFATPEGLCPWCDGLACSTCNKGTEAPAGWVCQGVNKQYKE